MPNGIDNRKVYKLLKAENNEKIKTFTSLTDMKMFLEFLFEDIYGHECKANVKVIADSIKASQSTVVQFDIGNEMELKVSKL